MTDREKKLERALLAIEGLCLECEDEFSSTVYRIAHVATGYCGSCKDDGLLDEVVAGLKDRGVIDVDNVETNHVLSGLHRAGKGDLNGLLDEIMKQKR